jgi:hypothetical protein
MTERPLSATLEYSRFGRRQPSRGTGNRSSSQSPAGRALAIVARHGDVDAEVPIWRNPATTAVIVRGRCSGAPRSGTMVLPAGPEEAHVLGYPRGRTAADFSTTSWQT